MKARMQRETVLLYHLDSDTEKGKAIQNILEEMWVTQIYLSEQDLGERLGALACLYDYERTGVPFQGEVPQRELIIFSAFSERRLNRILGLLREHQLTISLKAVITAYNKEWPLFQLFGELEQEHLLFEKISRLQKLMKESELLPEAAGLIKEAELLLAGKVLSLTELDLLVDKFEGLLGRK